MAERRGIKRLAWTGLGLGALGFAGFLYVDIAGSAIVLDETGEVASAVITNGREEQVMYQFPGGHFFAVPAIEGTIEVRCRNGASAQWGYVTGNFQTTIRVIGSVPCGRLVEEL